MLFRIRDDRDMNRTQQTAQINYYICLFRWETMQVSKQNAHPSPANINCLFLISIYKTSSRGCGHGHHTVHNKRHIDDTVLQKTAWHCIIKRVPCSSATPGHHHRPWDQSTRPVRPSES